MIQGFEYESFLGLFLVVTGVRFYVDSLERYRASQQKKTLVPLIGVLKVMYVVQYKIDLIKNSYKNMTQN